MQKPVSILTLKKYKSLKNDFFTQKIIVLNPCFRNCLVYNLVK